MGPGTPTRFIDPSLLAGISHLDLVAKTVVDGFVAGLHRSPDFGFSQEFAEYRAYTPGDDLRHVDWNVFARTERAYLKRYRGETNSQLIIMLDSSASMGYTSHNITKLDYGRFLAVSLAYLGNQQRDALVAQDKLQCTAVEADHGFEYVFRCSIEPALMGLRVVLQDAGRHHRRQR